jgi:hypothetical protein
MGRSTRAAAGVLAALAVLTGMGPATAAGPADLGFDRMVQPFLGTPLEPPTAAELADLDFLGNRNGRYDIGDLRLVLYQHPELIPAARSTGR